MFKLFKKNNEASIEAKNSESKARHADMYLESLSTIQTWFDLTIEMIEKQYKRLLDARPALDFQLKDKLNADPELKSRILANLTLDDSGTFDCIELAQLRAEIDAADAAADVVLRNERAAIIGKVKLANSLDIRDLKADPTMDIRTLTPYYDLDFVKAYLKI